MLWLKLCYAGIVVHFLLLSLIVCADSYCNTVYFYTGTCCGVDATVDVYSDMENRLHKQKARLVVVHSSSSSISTWQH